MRVYTAADCHLCHDALNAVQAVRAEMPFGLDVIDIGGDPVLEKRYRAWLPVVEIDGRRAFTYEVDAEALREHLRAP